MALGKFCPNSKDSGVAYTRGRLTRSSTVIRMYTDRVPFFGTLLLSFSLSNSSCAMLSLLRSLSTFAFNLTSLSRNLKIQKQKQKQRTQCQETKLPLGWGAGTRGGALCERENRLGSLN